MDVTPNPMQAFHDSCNLLPAERRSLETGGVTIPDGGHRIEDLSIDSPCRSRDGYHLIGPADGGDRPSKRNPPNGTDATSHRGYGRSGPSGTDSCVSPFGQIVLFVQHNIIKSLMICVQRSLSHPSRNQLTGKLSPIQWTVTSGRAAGPVGFPGGYGYRYGRSVSSPKDRCHRVLKGHARRSIET